MNIREVEELTGLVRANIRYYEQEGFLTPERESNGYRNYTDENVRVLKRIKLLRMLQVPIEEIRRLQSDEVMMCTVLNQSIRRAEEKKKELDNAQQICKRMSEDHVMWSTLDADRYLRQFGKTEEEEAKKEFSVSDYKVCKPHNIRRYLARMVDMELYVLIMYAVYYLILSPRVHLNALYNIIIQLFMFLLTYLLEPFLLHFFGTTPGKWIMGIRVYHLVGRNLTIEEGRRRTWSVLLWGYGLGLPIFNLIRLIKSAYDNTVSLTLPWDNGGEYEIEVEEMDNWKKVCLRIGGLVLALVLLVGTQLYLQLDAQYPPNRGKLTKAELAENINEYLDAFGIYSRWELDKNLNWHESTTYSSGRPYNEVEVMPQLQVEEKDGNITAISFQLIFTEGGDINSYDSLIRTFLLAYGGAQPEVHLGNNRLKELLNLTSNELNGGFSGRIAGVDMDYQLKNEGYISKGANRFFGWDGDSHRLTITFSMTLSE